MQLLKIARNVGGDKKCEECLFQATFVVGKDNIYFFLFLSLWKIFELRFCDIIPLFFFKKILIVKGEDFELWMSLFEPTECVFY